MVAFEVACRNREGVRFIPPEEIIEGTPEETRRLRLPFRWQVEVRQGGKPYRLGVEPDRVFGFELHGTPENRRRAYFFLEADRGTMPVARKGLVQTSFLRKLLAYRETWRRGLHRSHLAIPNFRVLTVTTSWDRMETLMKAYRDIYGGSSSLFLFTNQRSFVRTGNALDHQWEDGRREVVRLMPTDEAE